MPAKSSDRKLCFISGCPYDRKVKGICGQHYYEHRTAGLWNTEVALFELESTYSPPTMGYYSYKRRLKAMGAAIPVEKKTRIEWERGMLAAYRKELDK